MHIRKNGIYTHSNTYVNIEKKTWLCNIESAIWSRLYGDHHPPIMPYTYGYRAWRILSYENVEWMLTRWKFVFGRKNREKKSAKKKNYDGIARMYLFSCYYINIENAWAVNQLMEIRRFEQHSQPQQCIGKIAHAFSYSSFHIWKTNIFLDF